MPFTRTKVFSSPFHFKNFFLKVILWTKTQQKGLKIYDSLEGKMTADPLKNKKMLNKKCKKN
jgi:hypothetical protein